jgi:hypothetical protein
MDPNDSQMPEDLMDIIGLSYSQFMCLGKFNRTTSELQHFKKGSEAYLIGLFDGTNLCAIYANQVIIMERDVYLTHRIRVECNSTVLSV